MKFEAVGRVAMGDLGLEIGGQIDNIDRTERTLLGADTASNTQVFGNEGDLGLGGYFNAEPPASHDGAGLFAFLSAFL